MRHGDQGAEPHSLKKRQKTTIIIQHLIIGRLPPHPPFKQESHAVAGKPRDAAVNLDRYRMCRQLFGCEKDTLP